VLACKCFLRRIDRPRSLSMARFQASLPLLGGIGWTISPPIVGSFTDHFGLRMAWPILGAIAALAGLSIFYLGLMEKRANKR
ncbi:MAG TPA: hypothetical protein PLS97_03435, partial [Rectinema sp.]|nr:hypothetical protein [Rectinema sp.]